VTSVSSPGETWHPTACILCSRNCGLEVQVDLAPGLRPGVVTLPHGYGMEFPDASGRRRTVDHFLNWLTDAGRRDPLTATPYHKYVRVRVRSAEGEDPAGAPTGGA